jgi:drug/metabolite transporter (DMT)-like permease
VAVILAFITVVVIWSTTPLGIVWSSESIHPAMALLLRMVIAIAIGLVMARLMKVKLNWQPKALQVYGYSSLSIFLGMLCCYLAARYISSGLMSLCFGLAPILSALFAQRLLFETKFTAIKKVAMTLSFVGLAVVCYDNLALKENAEIGIGLIMIGVVLFSLSGVLVKRVPIRMHPLSTTLGSLIVSLPFYVISWWLLDGTLNYEQWQPKAFLSVVYLGIFGSLVGFLAYFYILRELNASTVSLVTMMTPVLSATLGILLNDEPFSDGLVIGGSLIVFGLGLFLFGQKIFKQSKTAELA